MILGIDDMEKRHFACSPLNNADLTNISATSIPTKSDEVKPRCVTMISTLLVRMYEIRIATIMNGESIARVLWKVKMRNEYKSRGGMK